MKPKPRTWLQAAVIALAGAWTYGPAFIGKWLSDDEIELTGNADLRDVAGLGRIWRGTDSPDYFPVKSSVQWVEWHLWHDRPLGYHLVSFALHLAGALLLWRVLGKLGLRQAWLGGLLFALHPLAVESVAWISELKNTLSLVPLLLAISAYLDWEVGTPGRAGLPGPPGTLAGRDGAPGPSTPLGAGGRALPILWFAIATLCKSSVVMLPAALLLYAWWRRGRIGCCDLLAALPFAFISFALGLVTISFQAHRAIRGVTFELGGIASRLAASGVAAAFYVAKALVPVRLAFAYPRWTVTSPTLASYLPWFLFVALFTWLLAAKRRSAVFALGWFLLNLFPVLGFVPMAYQRFSWVADHFAYLSLLGLAGFAAGTRGRAGLPGPPGTPAGRNGAPGGRALPTALFLLCLVLAFLSHRRAAVFVDENTLWTQSLAVNPASPVAHNNLGFHYLNLGRFPDAALEFNRALELDPNYPEARNNLGSALLKEGRPAEAARQFEETLSSAPSFAMAQSNLADALQAEGNYGEAIEHYEAALRLRPDYADAAYNLASAHNNLGIALAHGGRFAEAAAHYEQALRLQPNFPEAENNLGLALAKSGRVREAIPHFQSALRLNPAYPEARHNLQVAEHALLATP